MKDLFGNSNGEPNGGAHEDHDSEGEEEVDEFEWEAIEDEDTRGVDDFLAWVTGPKFKEIKRVALDGEEDITDYLSGKCF